MPLVQNLNYRGRREHLPWRHEHFQTNSLGRDRGYALKPNRELCDLQVPFRQPLPFPIQREWDLDRKLHLPGVPRHLRLSLLPATEAEGEKQYAEDTKELRWGPLKARQREQTK